MKVAGHADRIAAAGATALFVVHDPPDRVRELLLADVGCPFPVLVDTDRVAYRAWGLRRASPVTVWLDPAVWRQYWTLLRSGQRFRGLGGDVRQLGGDFVVDADGHIAYRRPQQRDDRPPVAELLAVLEGS